MSALKNISRYALPFLLIPLTVVIGAYLPFQKNYIFVSCVIAVLSLLLFYCSFDTKKLTSRRLVLSAVMTSLCVIGRFIPFFKPVTAITVISSSYMGAESGFLIGSLSALISNMYFGQGPWTPFQMVAWGIIGYVSGLIAPLLKKSKLFAVIFSALCGILFSLIMDVWTALWYNGELNISLYFTAVATSLPHMLLYTVSNVAFTLALYRPMGERFERIKMKYGI